MTRITSSLFVLFLLAGLLAAQTPMTPIQAVSLRRVSSPIVSPDGAWVAFFRSEPRLAGDAPGSDYRHLWIMPADGRPGDERRLLGGKRSVSGAAFSPDGKSITYVHRGPDAPHREVYALPLTGGEPVRVTRSKRGVSSYHWSADGRQIAYAASDPQPAARSAARELGFGQEMFEEDWAHVSLWVWDVAKQTTRQLTRGVTVTAYEWSADGSKLAVGLIPKHLVDDSYMFVRLHVLNVRTGATELKIDNPGKLGAFALSPDGRRLAYLGAQNKRDPHAGMLYVADMAGKITAFDDDFRGMFHTVRWLNDEVLEGVLSRGVTPHRYRAWPGMYLQTHAAPVAYRATTRASTSTLFCAASTGSHADELYRIQGDVHVRMTNSNPWLKDVALGAQTVEKIKARDGLEFEGLLIHPTDGGKGERRPLVVVVHGGPESHHSNGWLTSYSYWGQILAGRGYYVWYPNYRASTGHGVKFAMADHGDPMGGEFTDHLDAIAAFAKRGLIDDERVGIGGGSYGGYTAAWAATRQTDHFACAVSFVPFVDIRTKWMTSDIPWEFYLVHYEEKWPWQQEQFLRERSPLTYATNCRTPLLLLGGTADPRVHPSQPHMLYRAVQRGTKTPVRYIRYPGEGHGNRINTNRYDYLIRTLRWLDHYLTPGATRTTAPPPVDLDYSEWAATK